MNRQLIELGSLAHLSYFWFTLDGVPWQVKRHAEDYTFVEAFGGQEFPTQELVPSYVEVYVSDALPWQDSRETGTYLWLGGGE
jgi:hypothetical protein